MSGHSKWHSIKHKKAATDARKGKVFTRVIKEIIVAARLGGGDPNANPKLRTALQAARAANLPHDNIKRAIKKGTGELPGQSYEPATYAGYGRGGVAVLVETLSDNKNRTVSELRHIFSKNGGNLGETGCVNWMFGRRGCLRVGQVEVSEEKLLEVALESGAEDLQIEGDSFAIYTPAEALGDVKEALQAASLSIRSSELTMVPQNAVHVEGKEAEATLKLIEVLEDHDDVQNVYSNFDIDETEMEAIAAVPGNENAIPGSMSK